MSKIKSSIEARAEELFSDAQVAAVRFPAQFAAPSLRELAAIRPGDMVKVRAARELFWVEVTQRDRDTLVGIVADLLESTCDHGLQLDDLVVFELRQVYQIVFGYLGASAVSHKEGKL